MGSTPSTQLVNEPITSVVGEHLVCSQTKTLVKSGKWIETMPLRKVVLTKFGVYYGCSSNGFWRSVDGLVWKPIKTKERIGTTVDGQIKLTKAVQDGSIRTTDGVEWFQDKSCEITDFDATYNSTVAIINGAICSLKDGKWEQVMKCDATKIKVVDDKVFAFGPTSHYVYNGFGPLRFTEAKIQDVVLTDIVCKLDHKVGCGTTTLHGKKCLVIMSCHEKWECVYVADGLVPLSLDYDHGEIVLLTRNFLLYSADGKDWESTPLKYPTSSMHVSWKEIVFGTECGKIVTVEKRRLFKW